MTPPQPVIARPAARRRAACSRHSALKCKYAPRPNSRCGTSATSPLGVHTSRNSSALSAFCRQPRHVRTGWLTISSLIAGGTTPGFAGDVPGAREDRLPRHSRSGHLPTPVSLSCGYGPCGAVSERMSIRHPVSGRPVGHSGLLDRSPTTTDNRERSLGQPAGSGRRP